MSFASLQQEKENIQSLTLPRAAQQPDGIPATPRPLFLKALHCFLAWVTVAYYTLHSQGKSSQAAEPEPALPAAAGTVQGTAVPHPN